MINPAAKPPKDWWAYAAEQIRLSETRNKKKATIRSLLGFFSTLIVRMKNKTEVSAFLASASVALNMPINEYVKINLLMTCSEENFKYVSALLDMEGPRLLEKIPEDQETRLKIMYVLLVNGDHSMVTALEPAKRVALLLELCEKFAKVKPDNAPHKTVLFSYLLPLCEGLAVKEKKEIIASFLTVFSNVESVSNISPGDCFACCVSIQEQSHWSQEERCQLIKFLNADTNNVALVAMYRDIQRLSCSTVTPLQESYSLFESMTENRRSCLLEIVSATENARRLQLQWAMIVEDLSVFDPSNLRAKLIRLMQDYPTPEAHQALIARFVRLHMKHMRHDDMCVVLQHFAGEVEAFPQVLSDRLSRFQKRYLELQPFDVAQSAKPFTSPLVSKSDWIGVLLPENITALQKIAWHLSCAPQDDDDTRVAVANAAFLLSNREDFSAFINECGARLGFTSEQIAHITAQPTVDTSLSTQNQSILSVHRTAFYGEKLADSKMAAKQAMKFGTAIGMFIAIWVLLAKYDEIFGECTFPGLSKEPQVEKGLFLSFGTVAAGLVTGCVSAGVAGARKLRQ